MIHSVKFILLGILLVGQLEAAPIKKNVSLKPSIVSRLMDVRPTKDGQIELIFDRPASEVRFTTEFLEDKIQLSFEDMSLASAKLLQLPSSVIKKVFVYHYSSKVVRARFFSEEPIKSLKNRLVLRPEGKVLRLRLTAKATKPEPNLVQKESVALQAPLAQNQVTLVAQENKNVKKAQDLPKESKILVKTLKESGPENREVRAKENPPGLKGTKDFSDPVESLAVVPPVDPLEAAEKLAVKEILTQNSASKEVNVPVMLGLGGLILFLCFGLWFGFHFLVKKERLRQERFSLEKGERENLDLISSLSDISAADISGLSEKNPSPKWMQVISKEKVDHKRELWLVRLGGKLVVMSVSKNSMQLLTELADYSSDFQVSQWDSEAPHEPWQAPGGIDSPLRSRIQKRLAGLKPL